MPLPSECIPLTSSLRSRILQRFAREEPPQEGQTLSRQELIAYLARSKQSDASPLSTIKRGAGAENRVVRLDTADHALLTWVSKAFSDWEEHYTLEAPLSDHVLRLRPLAVAMALSDESFCIPGAHPLHQLLDALQNGAVGWQRRLDRAGQMLEQRVERAVDKALDWFKDERTDLAAITRELVAANERDAARAQRMVQRLAETEEARIKTLTARRDAALDINRGLEKYLLPAAIGEFLVGPWYDSAQLTLIKFGAQSREWEQMRRATEHLMQSVQGVEAGKEPDRDRQDQILRHLPEQLRRCLLSLAHDEEATDSAIGLVEYAHLRLQHGQQLKLVRIPAIALDPEVLAQHDSVEQTLENGQWYRFEDDEGELRAQLVLQLGDAQHLLFANFVGLKALDLPRRAFNQRVDDGFVAALQAAHTFSISLAGAAGIDSEDSLERFKNPHLAKEQARDSGTAQLTGGPSAPGLSQRQATDDSDDSGMPGLQDTALTQDTQEWTLGDNDGNDTPIDPVLEPPEGAETDDGLELDLEPEAPAAANTQGNIPARAQETATGPAVADKVPENTLSRPVEPVTDNSTAEQAAAAVTEKALDTRAILGSPPPVPITNTETTAAAVDSAPPAPATAPGTPSPAPAPSEPPRQEAPPAPIEAPPPAASPSPPVPTPGPTATRSPAEVAASPPAPAPARPAEPPPRPPEPVPQRPPASPAPDPSPVPAPVPPAPAPAVPTASPPAETRAAVPAQSAADAAAPRREIDVPMGAWLGFHDGETPIMAKLAVFDPRRDNYIFVNRKGIAMRELNRAELADLVDRGLVDILETRCYFRDEVERAREEGS